VSTCAPYLTVPLQEEEIDMCVSVLGKAIAQLA